MRGAVRAQNGSGRWISVAGPPRQNLKLEAFARSRLGKYRRRCQRKPRVILRGRARRMVRHFSSPAIRVPWFFNLAEGGDQFLRVLPLYVVTAVVKNVNHRIIIQPEDGAGVEGKTMR